MSTRKYASPEFQTKSPQFLIEFNSILLRSHSTQLFVDFHNALNSMILLQFFCSIWKIHAWFFNGVLLYCFTNQCRTVFIIAIEQSKWNSAGLMYTLYQNAYFCSKIHFWQNIASQLILIFAPKFKDDIEFQILKYYKHLHCYA